MPYPVNMAHKLAFQLTKVRKDGTLKDTFTIKSKRHIDENFNIDDFMESIKIDYNEKSYKSNIVWDNNAYGHIERIDVVLKFNNNYTLSKYIGPNSNTAVIGTTYPTKDYEYEIIVHDYEGNTYRKTLLLDNDESLNVPTDMKINITQREDQPDTYDVNISYSKNNTEEILMNLKFNKVDYEVNSGHVEITSTEPISEDDITVELYYKLFSGGSVLEFNKDNAEITIELAELPEEPENPDKTDEKIGINGIKNIGITRINKTISDYNNCNWGTNST